jgi:hypothetical protein
VQKSPVREARPADFEREAKFTHALSNCLSPWLSVLNANKKAIFTAATLRDAGLASNEDRAWILQSATTVGIIRRSGSGRSSGDGSVGKPLRGCARLSQGGRFEIRA